MPQLFTYASPIAPYMLHVRQHMVLLTCDKQRAVGSFPAHPYTPMLRVQYIIAKLFAFFQVPVDNSCFETLPQQNQLRTEFPRIKKKTRDKLELRLQKPLFHLNPLS